MRVTRDIQSLSDFKQNASKFIKQVQQTKEPLVLTVNGKATVVVQDVESYQANLDAIDRSETVAEVKNRLEYVRRGGKLIRADEVFRTISEKYGITFD